MVSAEVVRRRVAKRYEETYLEYSPGTSVLHKHETRSPKLCWRFFISVSAFAAGSIYYLLFMLVAMDFLLGVIGGIPNKTVPCVYRAVQIQHSPVYIAAAVRPAAASACFCLSRTRGLSPRLPSALRLIAACIPLALMLTITEYNDLTNALVQVTRLPYKYAFTLSTTIRFIPLFLSEMSAIMEAQTARGVELDAGGFFQDG